MRKAALIMAGGRGERFWPKSRKSLPKQFLSLTDDGKTMIQLTVERILPLVDAEDIYIATNKDYLDLVKEQLPFVKEENILCEPVGRNTAPCIALGAVHIAKKYEDALMMVLPSDHLIKLSGVYQGLLEDACEVAKEDDNLVTIGIAPEYPETGYGYIKFIQSKKCKNAYEVDRFVEKPNLELAMEYLETEEYLWNSGMFIWKVSSILQRIEKLMPDLYEGILKIQAAIGTSEQEEVLKTVFPTLPSTSIDYGIMEKSNHIYTVPGSFGWDDVGSWLAIERIKKTDEQHNVINGNAVVIESEDCIIQADRKLIAAIGLKDIVVVDTEDATLICNKHQTADIKKVIAKLRENQREEYL